MEYSIRCLMMHGSCISFETPTAGVRNDLSLFSATKLYPSLLYARCRPSSPLPLKYEKRYTLFLSDPESKQDEKRKNKIRIFFIRIFYSER
jgi:hypothetical protein